MAVSQKIHCRAVPPQNAVTECVNDSYLLFYNTFHVGFRKMWRGCKGRNPAQMSLAICK